MTVYSVLNSLLYCEPVEKSKQRSDLLRFVFLFSLLFVFVCFSERGEQHRSDWTKAMDSEEGRPERRELQ